MAVRSIFLNRVYVLSSWGHFCGVCRAVGATLEQSTSGAERRNEAGEVGVAKIQLGVYIRPYRKPTQVGA